jgi:hypothetical protein
VSPRAPAGAPAGARRSRFAQARDPDVEVRRLLGSRTAHETPPPASLSGLEQEYGVWIARRQVDFGELIDRVAPPDALRRFAFDARARIVRSGAVWTVDAPHAEVATPPRALQPGIAGRLADDALHERDALLRRLRALEGLLPAHTDATELRGYSTHLNAFADRVDRWALARHFAATYAPAVMLLAERRGSPGLLVRPRPQRLEIGTEYLERRSDLVAASLVVLAAVIAAWRECRADGPIGPAALLPALDSRRFVATWQRPGIFVARDAFGDDLYELGRTARLRLADGREQVAGRRLGATWGHLRSIAQEFALPAELTLVDDLVDGRTPLPIERAEPQDPPVRRHHRPPSAAPGPQAALLQKRARGRVSLAPELVTWDQAILRVDHPRRSFFLAIPRDASARFLERWAGGRLDAPLAAFALREPTGRTALLDEVTVGLFDTVEPPAAAAERLEHTKEGGPPSPGGQPKRSTALPRVSLPPTLITPSPAPPPHFAPPQLVPPPPVVPQPPSLQTVPPEPLPPQVAPPVRVPPGGAPPQPPPPRPQPRLPWRGVFVGVVVFVTVITAWTGAHFLTGPGGSQAPSTGVPCVSLDANGAPGVCQPAPSTGGQNPTGSPTPTAECLPNAPCQSAAPAGSPAASRSPTACVPGVPCGSPATSPAPAGSAVPSQATPAPTQLHTPGPSSQVTPGPTPPPAPSPQPSPVPTPQPTQPPDVTGPSITQLAWSPGLIGVPVPNSQACGPNSNLGQAVQVTVQVSDPSGVASVTLRYQRAGDAAPVSIAMGSAGGDVYVVVLSTANSPGSWYPPANAQSYSVDLGVTAVDGLGNPAATAFVAGFSVTFCQ